MASYQIDFEPVGRRGECSAHQSLLDCARQLGVELVSICGGQGLFHCCEIQVLSGTVSEPTAVEQEDFSAEQLAQGYRLACQTYPTSDLIVCVPPQSLEAPQRTQVECQETIVRPEPPVRAYRVQLSSPSLSDLRADAERLSQALKQQHGVVCRTMDVDVLRGLSPRLRSWDWEARASLRGQELVALGPSLGRQLGLAVDLGTTKIAGYLIDLDSGQTLAAKGVMNPQIAYGEDVISRMTRTKKDPAEASRLQELAVEAVNQLAADLCAEVDVQPEEIVEATVVGNTAMHHIFLRLPVEQLALSPYLPAVKAALAVKARDVGLDLAPGAYVHLLPNIAGFVGADHVAMLLATQAYQAEGVTLAVDIGTNTEVCLVSEDEMTSVSCPSGPAFEGAHLKHGMRAARGAIEHLRLVADSVEYQTVDGAPPVGICGSGILDGLAQLYLSGVVGGNGRMVIDHPRVRTRDGEREFILVSEDERQGRPAIAITQHDVRELQLAKGAVRAGIQVLLETKGLSDQDVEQVIIAGAFGTYIDVASAVTIGMLPPLPLDGFRQVGNAAGLGAKLALVSRSKRADAQAVADRVGYVELASVPSFMQTFVEANYIGVYRLAHGERQETG
ncbi:MAG: ASKHA domain-containing protein [Chloroflexota bacterium]